MQTIERVGTQLTLRTRQGGDLRYRLKCWGRNAQGRTPLDLSLYEVVARVRDMRNQVRVVPATAAGCFITVHFTAAITAALGNAACAFSIELRRDGITHPFVFGTITCERSL